MAVNLLREDNKEYNLVNPDKDEDRQDDGKQESSDHRQRRQNPHDKFFKSYFSEANAVRDFAEYVLSREFYRQLDMSTLEREDRTFVTGDLREYFADIIYAVRCMGKQLKLAFILEHKSYRDQNVTFQMIKYMNNYMQREYQEAGKLTPIIPILIYQERDSADSGLVDLEKEFAEYSQNVTRHQIIFEVVEYKLTALSWKKFTSRILKIFGLAATMSEAEDDLERVKEIAAELAAMSEKSRIEFVRKRLVPVVEYILTVTDLDEKIIREVIEEKLPGGGDIVESTAERLRKEGRKDILDLILKMKEKFGEDSLELIGVIKDKEEIQVDKITQAIEKADDIEELREKIE